LLFVNLFILLNTTSQALANDVRVGVGAGIFDTLDNRDTLTGSLILEAKPISGMWSLRPTLQLLAIDDSGYYLGVGVLKGFFINKD
jgi:hypothetical protein